MLDKLCTKIDAEWSGVNVPLSGNQNEIFKSKSDNLSISKLQIINYTDCTP